MTKKLLALTLSLWLFIYSLLPTGAFVVFAQEASPETTASPSPEPSVEPSPTPSPQPTPTPSPTPPPYWSEEYDVWKAEQDILDAQAEAADDAREVREDEWETNEGNQGWVDSHGGSEEYYTSGQWQTDQDAQAAAAAAAAEAAPAEEDPFASEADTHPQSCGETESEGLSDPTSSTLSEGTVDGTATSFEGNSTEVNNDNCASIENDSLASGASGENLQSGNDGDVGMNTGDSSAEGRLSNEGNTNVTDSDDFSSASASAEDSFAEGSDAENVATGEDSENLASGTEVDSLSVDNDNTAYVDNQMAVEGVSGLNEVTDNDGNATLTTGDIELIANMLNILNLNITGEDFLHLIVNIFGTLNGTLDLDDIALALGFADDDDLEIIARNEDTGEDSENTAQASGEETTTINNTNSADVNNEMNVSGVSGGNEVSGNDGAANVVTGRIKILANLMNFINANFSGERWSFIMINIFGGLIGDLILPSTDQYLNGPGEVGALAENVNLGEDSTNTATATSAEKTTVANSNDVSLSNNVNAEGVSGNNQQNGNDDGEGAHSMQTGAVDVAIRIMDFLNFNITGNNWVFLIVNVFGKWMGQIVGFAGGGAMDAPSEGTFSALSVGGGGGQAVVASNSNTGEGSTNTAEATYTSDTSVTNQNSATVTNNMNIEGVSGENAVNGNDAGTSLTTGWVEISANLLNIINMNVTGRSWMIVFLNVFGDFMGDLFFGPPPPPPAIAEVLAQTQNTVNQVSQNLTPASGVGGSQVGSSEMESEEALGVAEVATSALGSAQGRISAARGEQEILTFTAGESFEEGDFEIGGEFNLPFPQNLLAKLLKLKEEILNFLALIRDMLGVAFAHFGISTLSASE